MSFSVNTNPTSISDNTPVDYALLRQIANQPISLTGQTDNSQIGSLSVTADKVSLGAWFWCSCSTAFALTPSSGETLGSYADGTVVAFRATVASAGSDTASISGLTAKNIYKFLNAPLAVGDIVVGQIVELRYNSSQDAFQMISPLGAPSPHVVTDTSASANAISFTASPAITLFTGLRIAVKMANNNTAAVTITDGTFTKNVKRSSSVALVSGELKSGQCYTLRYDGTQFLVENLPSTSTLPTNPVAAVSHNLVITNGSSADAVTITADEVMLVDSSGNGYIARSVSLTCTINTGSSVALNSLETGGSSAANTWYYLWIISNGTDVACVASLESASHTVPIPSPDLSNAAFSGYTYKALVGVVKNAYAATTLINSYQRGKMVWCDEQVVFTAKAGQSSYGAQTLVVAASGSDAYVVPALAGSCFGNLGSVTSASPVSMVVAADANGLGACRMGAGVSSDALDTFTIGVHYMVPLKTAQSLYWKSTDNGSAYFRLTVTGYCIE